MKVDWSGSSVNLTTGDYMLVIDGTPWPTGTPLPDTIVFGEGKSSVTVKVVALDDKLSEGLETIKVELKPDSGSGYSTGHNYKVTDDTSKQTAKTDLHDDTDSGLGDPVPYMDGPTLSLYVVENNTAVDSRTASVWEDTPVYESDGGAPSGSITYRVQLEADDGTPYPAGGEREPITVSLTLSGLGGAAYGESGGDYFLTATDFPSGVFKSFDPATGKLVLEIPSGSNYVDIPVHIVSDTYTERNRVTYKVENGQVILDEVFPDEQFKLTLDEAKDNEARINQDKKEVTTDILEEIIATQVQIGHRDPANITPTEEGQDALFTVSLTKPTTEKVTVWVKVSSNNPEDLVERLFEVEIPTGSTSKNLDVTIFNDTFGENIEDYTLEILRVVGGEAIINEDRKSVTGQIKDDMNGPVIEISGDAAVQESCGQAGYTITLGDTVKTPGLGCEIPSQDITITLELQGATDDAAWPETVADLHLTGTGVRVHEDCLGPNGTLKPLANGSIKIVVPEGFDEGSFGFKVDIVDDALTEEAKDFFVVIDKVEGSESVKGSSSSAKTTIHDDTDYGNGGSEALLDGPFVHLTGDVIVSESGGAANYTITLRDAQGTIIAPEDVLQDITITLKYTGVAPGTDGNGYFWDTAETSKDFTELPDNITVVIKAGSNTATIVVPIADDKLSEKDERFSVEIDTVKGHEAQKALDPEDRTVVTTIVDDTNWNHPGHENGAKLDGPIASLIGSSSVYESSTNPDISTAVYQIKLSCNADEPVTITLKYEPVVGEASHEDIDFDAFVANNGIDPLTVVKNADGSFSFKVTITPPDISYELELPIKQDDLTETGEKFSLTMEEAVGGEVQIKDNDPQHPSSVTTVIYDDVSGPSVSITVGNVLNDQVNSFDGHASFNTTTIDDAKVYFKVDFNGGTLDNATGEISQDVTVVLRVTNAGGTGIAGKLGLEPGIPDSLFTDNGDGTYTLFLPKGVHRRHAFHGFGKARQLLYGSDQRRGQ